tara:strand:+ start:1703 stop:4405 length:2703 start_codon:yes stop_codon:yes gene_type:complete
MAEKIVSPGVFTNERDLSFLPASIGEIGAAIIGPTVKGPAFEPTIIESFKEFEAVFGPKTKESYVPYTVEMYLKSAGRVTIVRILGLSGYLEQAIDIAVSGSYNLDASPDAGGRTVAVLAPGQVDPTAKWYAISASNTKAGVNGDGAEDNVVRRKDFGDASGFLLFLSASSHPTEQDSAGNAIPYSSTTNFTTGHAVKVAGAGSSNHVNTTKTGDTAYSASLNPSSEFLIDKVFGTTPKDRYKPVYLKYWFKNAASASYAAHTTVGQKTVPSVIVGGGSFNGNMAAGNTSTEIKYNQVYSTKNGYEARTPFIVSQKVGGKTVNLFKIHTRAHGTSVNHEIKACILNVRAAGTVAGSEYGSFSLQLRRVKVDGSVLANRTPYKKSNDSDRAPEVVEQFNNLTLDPNNPNFLGRAVGDRYQSIDADGKVTVYGDYANKSNYIWLEIPDEVKDQGISAELVPFGYAALIEPVPSTFKGVPSASTIGVYGESENGNEERNKKQIMDGVYNKAVFYGFDFTNVDNLNYLTNLPNASTTSGNNKAFNLSDCWQHPSASLDSSTTPRGENITPGGSTINLATKKFAVPFQGGFDGYNPSRFVGLAGDISAANLFGFDCSTAQKDGTLAYKRAVNAVSNPDEYDINMMATPGADHRLHSGITTHAKNTCEDRGDAFYVMDAASYADNITTVTDTIKAFDSNYTATYYPWVKILDTDINKPIWVPPSVVVPGAIAYNDKVAFEWFAPAGLNRGTLTEVIEVKSRLTHDERDDLYEGRVNPIATFPGQGVCIWGQKTLQAKPSALDRVNVRRLLIAVKKFIASATKYLVFENNTTATRNRFLNIVNPYLESIQQRQGLYAFKVIMDESNNTPDVIDRNQMIGELFLQPAKAAEFIILDFNILPTGAAFPE